MAEHDHHHDHDHDHDHHHGHGHGHGHHGHVHAAPGDPRYGLAIALNLAIVFLETGGGLLAHSTALIADAGHNLSDVLGLVLAGAAAWLAKRPARGRRTYGFGKATVLAALVNGVTLMFVSGGIVLAALERLAHPQAVRSTTVMIIAAAGVAMNLLTVLMLAGGRKGELNVRSAIVHMLGDAGVSAGVIIAAGLIWLSGWNWIDPVVSIAIVAAIAAGTWSLLKEATDLSLDAAPPSVNLDQVREFLEHSPGVTEVHDLHVWAMSTTEAALTAHLVHPQEQGLDQLRAGLAHELEDRFGLRHTTLQIEQVRSEHCPEC